MQAHVRRSLHLWIRPKNVHRDSDHLNPLPPCPLCHAPEFGSELTVRKQFRQAFETIVPSYIGNLIIPTVAARSASRSYTFSFMSASYQLVDTSSPPQSQGTAWWYLSVNINNKWTQQCTNVHFICGKL